VLVDVLAACWPTIRRDLDEQRKKAAEDPDYEPPHAW
jgi:hypothetical protein